MCLSTTIQVALFCTHAMCEFGLLPSYSYAMYDQHWPQAWRSVATFIIRHCLWEIVLHCSSVGVYLHLNLPVMCLIVIVLLYVFVVFLSNLEFYSLCFSLLSAEVISLKCAVLIFHIFYCA